MNAGSSLLTLIILPVVSAPLIYLAGRICIRFTDSKNIARWLALVVLLIAFVPLAFTTRHFLSNGIIQLQAYQINFRLDGISLLMSAVVLVLGIFVTLFSFSYMADEEGEEKFYALLVVMIGAIIGLSCTGDLFNLWVWFETMAISSYMLVAFYRNQAASLEAGVKYLVQSAVGSVFIILGIALVFSHTGTLDLVKIRNQLTGIDPMMITAGVFFVIGFGVKSALVPLHTWLPDAHSQAPSGISAMLSGIVIETGLVALLRSLAPFSLTGSSWGVILMGLGAVNMLLGNLIALRQTQIKRLLAYSSISHMGYILAGLGIAIFYGEFDGAAGSFFHLAVHALMKGLAFLSAGALLYALHLAQGNHEPLTRDDMAGVGSKYPLVAFTFSLAVLSLGGLPPLAGFMSKWQILLSGFETRQTGALLLMVFMALNSVLSLGYYTPLVNRMYRKEASQVVQQGKSLSFSMSIPLVLLAVLLVVIGFYPAFVGWLVNPAAASVLQIFGV
jgi:proton-translocating NADH-quinone oxidoreductase chain N